MSRWREDMRDATFATKVAGWVSVILGLLLLAWSSWKDSTSGWGLAYVPSVLSGLTGFLIGAPVALFFLNALNRDQVERSERRAALSLARRVAEDFDLVVRSCTRMDDSVEGVERRLNDLVACVDDFYTHAVTNVRDLLRPRRGMRERVIGVAVSREVWDRATNAAQKFLNQVGTATTLSQSRQALEWAGLAEAEWRFLERDVRARLTSGGLPWLGDDLTQILRRDLNILTGEDAQCLKRTRQLIQSMPKGKGAPTVRDVHDLSACAKSAYRWTHALKHVQDASHRPADFWAQVGGAANRDRSGGGQ